MPSGGLYATYHLLGEPETTIDFKDDENETKKTHQKESTPQKFNIVP